jgi:stage II sporulation protein R
MFGNTKISKSRRRIMKFEKIVVLICVFVLCMAICNVLPIHGEEKIYESVVRLHVLANSNSEEDQALKLLVKDEISIYFEELLEGCEDLNEAKRIIDNNRDDIVLAAESCIRKNGYSYTAALSQGQAVYPRREYAGLTFPAGSYYSVRLSIGEGHGRNWWCVLFPSVTSCCATVERCDGENSASLSVFSDNELDIIKENNSTRKEIRFFFLDLINGTLGKE